MQIKIKQTSVECLKARLSLANWAIWVQQQRVNRKAAAGPLILKHGTALADVLVGSQRASPALLICFLCMSGIN